jgi:hypothetical protein
VWYRDVMEREEVEVEMDGNRCWSVRCRGHAEWTFSELTKYTKTEMFTRLYLNHHLIILCICRLLL